MDQKGKIMQLKESFRYLLRLLYLVKPYWGKLIKGLTLGIIVSIIGMALPYLTKLLIDKVYPSQDITLMNIIVGAMLGVSITSVVLNVSQGYYNLVVNTHLSNSISLMFFNHLQHLKVRFYDEHRVGEVMSRFGDVANSIKTVNNVFQTIFINGIYLIIVPPFLFMLQWKLAIISLISLPLVIIIISVSGKFVRKYWKRSAEAFAELNAFQVESLSNIRLIKSMVLEKFVFRKSKDQIENAVNLQLKAGTIGQLMGLLNGFLHTLNIFLYTWLGWKYIITKEMSLGDYIAFTAYIGYLYGPLSQIINLFSDFQQSSVSLARMYEYLDEDSEQNPDLIFNNPPSIINRIQGNIEIKNVSFSYNNDKKVLSGINLKIEKGTITTILGASGSGKTTLLRLLLGMEQLKEGNIFVDEKPLSSYTLNEVRKQIAVVWQEFSIIKGTIWDNLTLGIEEIDKKLIHHVIEICKLDELINNLSNGYQTEVSEWGSTLSGGQRQRISIARAILRNSPILILDEATSNIDIKTEIELLENIFDFMKGRTILLVTHRVTCTHLSDKICFLEAGRINSIGSHEGLLNENELYRRMFSSASSNLKETSFRG